MGAFQQKLFSLGVPLTSAELLAVAKVEAELGESVAFDEKLEQQLEADYQREKTAQAEAAKGDDQKPLDETCGGLLVKI